MIEYRLTLQSDGEPGSGLGGELVNGYVSRDHLGRPVIAASHLKGLLRQTLMDMLGPLLNDDSAVDALLGAPGWRPAATIEQPVESSGEGAESIFHFTDCALVGEHCDGSPSSVRMLTRTALDATSGTIKDGSLRTQEAVRAGSVFHGRIHGQGNDLAEALLRLGLLSLRAVGGSRTRGGGQCVVMIEGESRSPALLLREVVTALQGAAQVGPAPAVVAAPAPSADKTSGQTIWFEVTFDAESPILCPETPEASNVLRSGFSIPGGAVQGAILHRLNRTAPALADACFASPLFRAWPLQPLPRPHDNLHCESTSLRVSLTHRVAKVILQDELASNFADEALDEPGSIYDRSINAPLKAADGVLLVEPNGPVSLWRSVDMPRVFSTHGVHNDRAAKRTGGRNLYSIEAMAPLVWRGILACPEPAASALEQLLAHDPVVSIGKARSVRGLGQLRLKRLDPAGAFRSAVDGGTVFITQSPIALPDQPVGRTTQDELKAAAEAWAKEYQLGSVETVWAAAGLRFGWNRHRKAGAAAHGRTPARRVILPGAVIRLQQAPDPGRLGRALLAGVGGDRALGYGALLPHPGKAVRLYREKPELRALRSTHGSAVQRAVELSRQNVSHLSASQIGAVLSRLERSVEEAVTFLQDQRKRGTHQYAKWQDTLDVIEGWIKGPADQVREEAKISLLVLRDQVVVEESSRRSKS